MSNRNLNVRNLKREGNGGGSELTSSRPMRCLQDPSAERWGLMPQPGVPQGDTQSCFPVRHPDTNRPRSVTTSIAAAASQPPPPPHLSTPLPRHIDNATACFSKTPSSSSFAQSHSFALHLSHFVSPSSHLALLTAHPPPSSIHTHPTPVTFPVTFVHSASPSPIAARLSITLNSFLIPGQLTAASVAGAGRVLASEGLQQRQPGDVILRTREGVSVSSSQRDI